MKFLDFWEGLPASAFMLQARYLADVLGLIIIIVQLKISGNLQCDQDLLLFLQHIIATR